jgi:hypothetical protein
MFSSYATSVRALRHGAYKLTDIRTATKFQAMHRAATVVRAAGSPVVDEDRDWRRPESVRWDLRATRDYPAPTWPWAGTSWAY